MDFKTCVLFSNTLYLNKQTSRRVGSTKHIRDWKVFILLLLKGDKQLLSNFVIQISDYVSSTDLYEVRQNVFFSHRKIGSMLGTQEEL